MPCLCCAVLCRVVPCHLVSSLVALCDVYHILDASMFMFCASDLISHRLVESIFPCVTLQLRYNMVRHGKVV